MKHLYAHNFQNKLSNRILNMFQKASLFTLSLTFINLCHASNLMNLNMPKIKDVFVEPNTYLCTAFKVPMEMNNTFVIAKNPDLTNAHHIMVYLCQKPGVQLTSPEEVWVCNYGSASGLKFGSQCGDEAKGIIYTGPIDQEIFDKDNLGFQLLEGQYLVMEVHYPTVIEDHSASIELEVSYLQKRKASVQMIPHPMLDNAIPPNRKSELEFSCTFGGCGEMHPVAFQVHTHEAGINETIHLANGNENSLTLVGTNDPRKGSYFASIPNEDRVIFNNGDTLFINCQYDNRGDSYLSISHEDDNEMCIFYFLYFYIGDQVQDMTTCQCQIHM